MNTIITKILQNFKNLVKTLMLLSIILVIAALFFFHAAYMMYKTVGTYNNGFCIVYVTMAALFGFTSVLVFLIMKAANEYADDINDELKNNRVETREESKSIPSFESFLPEFEITVRDILKGQVPEECITREKIDAYAKESYLIIYGTEKERLEILYGKNNKIIELFDKIKDYDIKLKDVQSKIEWIQRHAGIK